MGCGAIRLISVCILTFGTMACTAEQESTQPSVNASGMCAPASLSVVGGATGSARVFMPDPLSSSGDIYLSPTTASLDSYTKPVILSHLSGEGVLKGTYIEAVNGRQCNDGFGAFSPGNHFSYPHGSTHFQEAMVYYFGDIYQSYLDSIGYLQTKSPVTIMAHCEMADENAFYVRILNAGGKNTELVCLGDSVKTPGASYSDDAVVTVHELEHATTIDSYSMTQTLNQFWYDEAGSLNEAISDFMGLIFTDNMITPSLNLDPRTFSRWALGTFDPKGSHVRGAHRCPVYDSNFPKCDHYPSFSFENTPSEKLSTISYAYPDGLGWPYSASQKGQYSARDAYLEYPSQEEIHNAGVLMLGALWDVYSALKANHSDDDTFTNKVMSQLILESIRHLPAANSKTNHSPVTFLGFASNLLTYSGQVLELNLSDAHSNDTILNDTLLIQQKLHERGLYDGPTITNDDWMEIGSGTNIFISESVTPGVYVEDNPELLQKWLLKMDVDSSSIPIELSTEPNSRLDPGEIAAVWFDIQNISDVTAGGVLLTVTSLDPDVTLLDGIINIGYMSRPGGNQTQIMYGKINGTSIVSELNPDNGGNHVPVGNSYFKTNPYFNHNWRTAIWVKVNPYAKHGKPVSFRVEATPANGVTSIKDFSVMIH